MTHSKQELPKHRSGIISNDISFSYIGNSARCTSMVVLSTLFENQDDESSDSEEANAFGCLGLSFLNCLVLSFFLFSLCLCFFRCLRSILPLPSSSLLLSVSYTLFFFFLLCTLMSLFLFLFGNDAKSSSTPFPPLRNPTW